METSTEGKTAIIIAFRGRVGHLEQLKSKEENVRNEVLLKRTAYKSVYDLHINLHKPSGNTPTHW